MLSSVLLLTLLIAFDPVRLGTILLLISRPRPVRSLTAYWVGAMTVSVPYLLVPLTLLHVIPIFRSFAQHVVAQATVGSPTVRHTQIGLGALVLAIAAVIAVRFWARNRAYLPASGGTTCGTSATLTMGSPVMDSNTPIAIAETVVRAQDGPAPRPSAMRRLRARTRSAWDSGASWVALVMGLASGPPPLTTLLVLTTIMASEAAIGAQVSAALGWVVVMFAVVEIILISYVASPVRTRTLLQLLHNWSLAHRRQVVVTILAVIGAGLVVHGMGGM